MIDQPVAKFMSHDVLRGAAEMPLREVIRQMNVQGQSAFVVCESKKPIGVITERDAVCVLDQCFDGDSLSHLTASDIMASPVHSLAESAQMGEVIRIMKERGFRRVPITDDKGQLSGIINFTELQAATNSALERRGRDLEVAVMARTAELQAANAKLESLSLHDSLTGLLNRRAMTKRLEEVHAVYERYGNVYSVILADIDLFKKYNDSLGHLAGDAVIRSVAETLRESVRTSDSVFRYGGEEFLAVLPETRAEQVGPVVERMRDQVVASRIMHPESPVSEFVTLSLGYTEVGIASDPEGETWDRVVERADRALYHAKETGRNRASAWGDFS